MWPQWWSFADVSQQGVDFSKKISKIRIIFWFDFHRCSHGPSKIRRHFRNKSRSILKLSKNVFYKKGGPKLILFCEKKNQKDSIAFWHRKLTLKVRFRDDPCEHLCKSNQKNIFLLLIFLLTSAKLHHWGHPSIYVPRSGSAFVYILLVKEPDLAMIDQ